MRRNRRRSGVNAILFKADPDVHKTRVLQMAAEFGVGLDGDGLLWRADGL